MAALTVVARNATPPSTKSQYRPEIDGLRALAVAAVIVNHFNSDLLPSGYLGVDIFFVISGFVITTSLASHSSKSFADFILGFYSRRIKRLIPALVVFAVVTSILICFFNPNPGTDLQTGMASLLGLSNLFLLINSTDYFATSTELNPFTHTWSLGVEEQFYLLFPLLVWFTGFGRLSGKGLRNLMWMSGVLSAASLIGFIYLYHTNQSAAYFLMPTRLWELGSGCLLFLGLKMSPGFRRGMERIPPLLMTSAILSVLLIPLQFAVQATIAAVILTVALLASLHPGTLGYSLLSHRRVVFIGLISYSLYLWHWSVLSISRWTLGIHWWSIPFQVALMLLLAGASYRYVETPLRRSSWSTVRWKTIGYGLGASLCAIGLLLTINSFRRKLYQGGEEVYRDNRLYQSLVLRCSKDCSKNIFVVGDSHAGHLGALFEMFYAKERASIFLHARGNGIPGASESGDFITPVLKHYQSDISPGDIIVLSTFSNKGIEKRTLQGYQNAIKLAASRSASVVIVSPTPYFRKITPYSHCNKAWFRPEYALPKDCTSYTSRADMVKELKATTKYLKKLRDTNQNLYVFDAFNILCPSNLTYCSSAMNGRPLYKDNDHLDSYGAEMLYAEFVGLLRRHNLIESREQQNQAGLR